MVFGDIARNALAPYEKAILQVLDDASAATQDASTAIQQANMAIEQSNTAMVQVLFDVSATNRELNAVIQRANSIFATTSLDIASTLAVVRSCLILLTSFACVLLFAHSLNVFLRLKRNGWTFVGGQKGRRLDPSIRIKAQ